MKRIVTALAAVLTLAVTATADAAPRTFYFKGTDARLANGSPLSDFGLSALPTMVTGFVRYDDAATPTSSSTSLNTIYETLEVGFDLGILKFSQTNALIRMTDRTGTGNDIFYVASTNPEAAFNISSSSRVTTTTMFNAADADVGSVTSASSIEQIRTGPWDQYIQFGLLNDMTGRGGALYFDTVEFADTPFSAVPLPASVLLLIAPLAGLAVLRRHAHG